MTRKEMKALIGRCYYAIERTGRVSDLREVAESATQQEREHRAMGRRFTGTVHRYALTQEDTGRYFACKIVLTASRAKLADMAGIRRDYILGTELAAAIRRDKVKIQISRADRAALLAIDYAGDIALPGY